MVVFAKEVAAMWFDNNYNVTVVLWTCVPYVVVMSISGKRARGWNKVCGDELEGD